MNNNIEPEKDIDLPFEVSKFDIGLWVYRHQIGLCVTLGVYLVFIIVVLFGQISLKKAKEAEALEIEIQTLSELEALQELLRESIEKIEKEEEIEDVINRVSNENMESESLNELSQNTQELLDKAAEIQQRMEANRAYYENGLAEVEAIKNRAEEQINSIDTTRTTRQDVKVQGNVTVSYSIINPIRNATKLDVPAYLCESGGEVKVQITVERSGFVTSAKVIQAAADDCITQCAVQAALRTEFNISGVAPIKHVGTITYIFIAQ